MSKTFDQIRFRLWPTRALTVEQEELLLQEWEELLEGQDVAVEAALLQTTLDKGSEWTFTAGELVDLLSLAPELNQLVMLDVYALDTALGVEVTFRVHLDHQPMLQLLELYRRRVLDPEQTLACLQGFNRVSNDNDLLIASESTQ